MSETNAETVWLTQEAHDKLEAELTHLKTVSCRKNVSPSFEAEPHHLQDICHYAQYRHTTQAE